MLELYASLAVLLVGCRGSTTNSQPAGSPAVLGLRQVVDIPLPGSSSRLDYQSLDQDGHRLYIAHLSASTVIAVDVQTNTVIGTVPGVSHVHGVLAVPQRKRVYASATGSHQIATIDAGSLQIIARTPGGEYPDGLADDPDDGKIYISDEHGGAVIVVSAQTNQQMGSIAVGGDVGNTQYDPVSKRIYTAVGATNQLVAIDPTQDQVLDRYDLPGCAHAHGLFIDTATHLAFIACDANATLVVFNLQTRTITAAQTVGDQPDVLAFDAGLGRLYVAAESGIVAVFREQNGTVTKLGQALLAANAHTVSVDQETHRVYFPLESVGGHPV
ncbi:MAG: YncE family protein, partial [Mycobacterium sp.]